MSVSNQSDLENKRLRDALKKREDEIKTQINQITQKDDEIQQLQIDLQNAKTIENLINEKNELINQLQNDLDIANFNQTRLQECELSINQLKIKEAADQQRFLEKENEINKLKADLQNNIRKQLEEKDLQIERLRDALRGVENERDGLQLRNLEKDEAYDELKTRLTSVQTENLRNQELSGDLAQAKSKIEELEEVVAKCRGVLFTDSETDQIFDRMKATKIQNKSLKLENLNLIDENEKLQEKYDKEQAQFQLYRVQRAEIEAENQSLKTQIARLGEQLFEAKAQTAAVTKVLDDASQYKEINSILERKIEELRKEKEASKFLQEKTDKEIQAIRRNRRHYDQETSTLRERIRKSQEENDALRSKISEAEDREEQLKIRNEETMNKVENLEDSNIGLLKKVTELQTEIQKLKNNN